MYKGANDIDAHFDSAGTIENVGSLNGAVLGERAREGSEVGGSLFAVVIPGIGREHNEAAV